MCAARESNPGRKNGNLAWYHYTSGAVLSLLQVIILGYKIWNTITVAVCFGFCCFLVVLQYNYPIPQIIIKPIGLYINAWFRNLFEYTCNTFGVSSTIHCVKICSLGGVAGCCLFVLLFCTLYFLFLLCLCYAFFSFFLIKKKMCLFLMLFGLFCVYLFVCGFFVCGFFIGCGILNKTNYYYYYYYYYYFFFFFFFLVVAYLKQGSLFINLKTKRTGSYLCF